MGYVYMAKAAAATPVTTPTGPIVWPPVWPWPPAGWPPLETGGTDPAWPPYGWPTIADWPTIDPDPTTGFEWPDPEDPTSGLDPVWPPAFPPAWPSDVSGQNYTLSLSCSATVDVGSALAFTCTTLDDGADTSDLNTHIIAVHALVDGSPVKLKKASGDDYVNMVWYYVSNYSGSSYGLSESVYLDIDSGDAGGTVTLCATVISTVPIITATDTATVQDNSMYASIATSLSSISAAINTSSSASLTPATSSVTATIAASRVDLYGGSVGTVVELRKNSSSTSVTTTGNVGTSGMEGGSWVIYRKFHKTTFPTYATQPTKGWLVFDTAGYNDNGTFDLAVYASNSDVGTIDAGDWDAGSELLASVEGVTSETIVELDFSNVDSGANCIVIRKSSEATNGMLTPSGVSSNFYLWIGA